MPSLAATLELKTEMANAHSGFINSVAFNNDGTKIVSGSFDKTIKVWGESPPYPTAASFAPTDDLTPSWQMQRPSL